MYLYACVKRRQSLENCHECCLAIKLNLFFFSFVSKKTFLEHHNTGCKSGRGRGIIVCSKSNFYCHKVCFEQHIIFNTLSIKFLPTDFILDMALSTMKHNLPFAGWKILHYFLLNRLIQRQLDLRPVFLPQTLECLTSVIAPLLFGL